MSTNIYKRVITDTPQLKSMIFTSDAECHGIIQKNQFLSWVKEYISMAYPGESASFYEDSFTNILSVVVVIGLNTLSAETVG